MSAVPILNTLINQGYEAYFVGGSVRDLILGKPIHDVDIATNAYPEEIKTSFRHTVDTGIQHGTVTVIDGENAYEVTTFRTESTYQDYRRPDSVEFVQNLSDDLKRRDFTINAFAMKPNGEVIDLFNGLADLENKVLRAVGNPKERFHEDALRMMRAVRFVSQLDFRLEAFTAQAIAENSQLLEHIAVERIREEFIKLGLGKGSKRAFADFIKLGLVNYVPHLKGKGDLLKTYQSLTFFPSTEATFWALLILLVKLPTAQISEFLRDWKNSNYLIKTVGTIIECFDIISEKDPTNKQLFRFGLPIIMSTIDLAHILGIEVNGIVLIDRYNNLAIKSQKDLAVDGKYLIENLNLKPGPELGQILTQLTNEVLNKKLENNVKSITKYVQTVFDVI